MQNHSTFNKFSQLFTIFIVLAFFLSACSGGNLSQIDTSQTSAQLQAKLSQPGMEPAKQNLPQTLQQAVPAEQSADQAVSGSQFIEPAAADNAAIQPSPAESSDPAAAVAETLGQAPVEAISKSAPAVDLSIPAEPKVGFRAPDFTLQTLGGATIRLSDFIGRPVVISYWATWCIPCQQELPILEDLAQEYQGQGLTVVTVNAIDQDTVEDVQTMASEKGMTLPILLDQGNQFASTYGALFFPTTIFVDASGVIRHIRLGDSSEADLRTKVENLLAGTL